MENGEEEMLLCEVLKLLGRNIATNSRERYCPLIMAICEFW
jgi:hypothetical protein